jgi:small subunit ribosomal protein S20
MAHHKSAKIRIRRNARRAVINRDRVGRVRTFIKKVEAAIAAGKKDEAMAALKAAQPVLQRGVTKGVVKAGTASRRLSRLSARIKALQA